MRKPRKPCPSEPRLVTVTRSGRGRYLPDVAVTHIEAPTLGEGWLAVSRAIREHGEPGNWGEAATGEVALLTLSVERPDSGDPLIAELGDPEWLDWMHRNFFVHEEVP